MTKHKKKLKKRIPSPAEVANDPSIRWFPYRQWELLWSDAHNEVRRFHHYAEDGRVVLATNAMGEIEGEMFDPLTVRRVTL